MSVINAIAQFLGGGGAASYLINRSVRLRSSASAYFSRTPASAGNRTTWTWSAWVKRGKIDSGGTQYFLLSNNSASTDAGSTFIYFYQDVLRITGFTTNWRTTTRVFRDPSAWYHLVIVFDTTHATASNRIRIYVNGVQETSFSTYNDIGLSATSGMNAATVTYMGADVYAGPTGFNDGYLAEINFIDGQALTPSSFGEYDSVRNTQWKPKRYTGTYGTNGFYLNFSDNSASTAAAIGKDSSGNGNNWTPSAGVSLTAGVTYDSMLDVPTLTSETASNFCTLNPLSAYLATLSDGNLKATYASAAHSVTRSTIQLPTSLIYFEGTVGTTTSASIAVSLGLIAENGTNASAPNGVGYWNIYASNVGYITNNNTNFGSIGVFTAGDLLQVAYDGVNNRAWFGKNNVWYDSSAGTTGNPSTGSNPTVTSLPTGLLAAVTAYANSLTVNFGQRPFAGTIPTGFKSLNTFNLPDGNVTSSDDYHKIYTYTGNGGGLQVGEVQKPMSLFNLDRSLRFRSSASAYLNRTQTTPTNSVKCTFSGWVKRGALGTTQIVFGGYTGTDADTQLYFAATNKLTFTSRITNVNGAAFEWAAESAAVFSDPFQWLHIVVKVDTSTSQATNNDYYTVYVNGIAQTFTTVSGATLVSAATVQNRNTCWNVSGYTARLATQRATNYFDGYLADINFIDGQALTPSAFGDWDGNYYWTPKAYTGTYGTNGFHLDFEDFSAATAAAIGKDTSGNSNNWTPSAGINLTAPANTNVSWDSMVDVPTLTSADVANFCTLNPLSANTSTLPTQGNLYLGNNAANNFACVGTIGVSSGKWYWELTPDSGFSQIGVTTLPALPANLTLSSTGSLALAVYGANGQKYDNGANTAYGATFTTTNVIGVALDLDAGTLTFYKDGVSQGIAFSGLSGTYYPVLGSPNTYNSGYINFGQRPFKYSNYGVDRPAATFKPINSYNIAEVTGDLESPDFVWIKSRSAGTDHALFNSVVGAGKYIRSSNTGVEVTDVNSLIQFNKNGFLLGNAAIVNTLAATYVASAWKVAATTVTNNAGSIATQVRANQTAGISLVTWTGTGASNPTLGHGLGKVPALIIAKDRDSNATDNNIWVYHKDIGTNYYILLTSPNLRTSGAVNGWIGTSPTDTTFTIAAGSTSSNNLNESGDRFEAICFAEIAGFSKFTSYSANASSTGDGPFINCGFSPRWLMIKRATGASGTGGWIMYDAARDTYNTMSEYMFAESFGAKGTLAAIDVTANGFKIKTNNVHLNQTANDIYLVMAFAEHPFKYALAR